MLAQSADSRPIPFGIRGEPFGIRGERSSAGGSVGTACRDPSQDGADTARIEGTLRITPTCVFLESGGGETALFWPADRTAWNREPATIMFTNFDGSTAEVRDGDEVVLGGGQGLEDVSAEEWIRQTEWVAPPSLSCALESRWGVGAVGR